MSLEGIKKTAQKKSKNILKKSPPKIKTIDTTEQNKQQQQQQEKTNKKENRIEDRMKNLEKGLLAAMNQIETQKQTIESLKEGLLKQMWKLLYDNNMSNRYNSQIYKSKRDCELDAIFGTAKPKKKH